MLFKALEQDCADEGGGNASAVALTHAQALAPQPVPAPVPALPAVPDDSSPVASPSVASPPPGPRAAPLRERIADHVRRFEAWCVHVELAPDLASDIGSRKWLRGG